MLQQYNQKQIKNTLWLTLPIYIYQPKLIQPHNSYETSLLQSSFLHLLKHNEKGSSSHPLPRSKWRSSSIQPQITHITHRELLWLLLSAASRGGNKIRSRGQKVWLYPKTKYIYIFGDMWHSQLLNRHIMFYFIYFFILIYVASLLWTLAMLCGWPFTVKCWFSANILASHFQSVCPK